MNNYQEKTVNVLTGEETLRPYTEAEIAQVEAAQAEAAQELIDAANKEAERQAVLDKLGLTADEARLLLG